MLQKSPDAITFVYDPAGRQYRFVSVAGEFNGWNVNAHHMATRPDGLWSVTVPLAPGRYQYKFVADGQWLSDPQADALHDDGVGGSNSVVVVVPPSAFVPPAPAPVPAAVAAVAAAPEPAPAPVAAVPPPPAEPPPPPREYKPVKPTGFTRKVKRVYLKKSSDGDAAASAPAGE